MSRMSELSQEITHRQFHRDVSSLPRNRRTDTIPMERIRISDIMKFGIPFLPFLVYALAHIPH